MNRNAVDTRLSSSPTHLINREPGYKAKPDRNIALKIINTKCTDDVIRCSTVALWDA